MPQECPNINQKKRTWYQARRHVCIARFLLRSASQGVQTLQRDRTRDSPFPPEIVFKTYLVPGWKARLSARHVWKMQIYVYIYIYIRCQPSDLLPTFWSSRTHWMPVGQRCSVVPLFCSLVFGWSFPSPVVLLCCFWLCPPFCLSLSFTIFACKHHVMRRENMGWTAHKQSPQLSSRL